MTATRFRFAIVILLGSLLGMSILPLRAQGACDNPPPRLVVGERGRVLPGDPNNVRDQPSASGVRVGQIPGGGHFTVLEGPVCAEGYNWWRIQTADVSGWTVEGADGDYWVEPLPADAPPEFVPVIGTCPHIENRIAFATTRTDPDPSGSTDYGQLITVNVDGSAPCQLTELSGIDIVRHPIEEIVWSPDGSQIAFTMGTGGFNSRIYLINADGTNLRPLTTADGEFFAPVWSPDGERLAFLDDNRVYVGFADGRGSRVVTEAPGQANGLSWSPDGQFVTYASSTRAGTFVFVIAPDGGEPRQLAEMGDENPRLTAWQPAMAALYVGMNTGMYQIVTSEALTASVVIPADEDDARTAPVYSPDGAFLAYFELDGYPTYVGTLNLLNTADDTVIVLHDAVAAPVNLTLRGNMPVSWSSDSRLIAYGDAAGLLVIDASTRTLTRIWEGVTTAAPQFQPSG
ncbi:MAG: hypothetical protein SF162_12980 [bacterium]|nr:hypothetical protein [bacterium]